MVFKVIYENKNATNDLSKHIKKILDNNIIIVCIGTDKFIGDCLGPMVGSLLHNFKVKIPVYGTIQDPIHALNLEYKMLKIYEKHPDSIILAIDACVTEDSSIGEIQFRPYPVSPGKGVGKKLSQVGDFSIVGIVEKKSNLTHFSSSGIRLNFIFELAKVISLAIKNALDELYIEKGIG